MDEENVKKLQQLECEKKLAVYKRKKSTKDNCTSDSSNSDNSLSMTLLPENRIDDNEELSDTNSISEHILSGSDSIENDRSLQEIEISNVPQGESADQHSLHTQESNAPTRFSLILQNADQGIDNISQENKPFSLSENFSLLSLNIGDKVMDKVDSSNNNVQSILEEILNKKMFYSDNSLKSDKCSNSNLSSLNIFEGINLDDNSITNYVTRLKNNETDNKDVRSDFDKGKHYEELITTKDMTINALNAELDSLREIASNTSSNSLNTSTTEYKQLYEEYRVKIVEYENAIVYRDRIIEQLTKSLEESANNREELKKQTEELSQEVLLLQEQCTVTTNYIKQHTCAETATKLDENQNSDANRLDVSSTLECDRTKDDVNLEEDILELNVLTKSNKTDLNDEYKILESTLSTSQLKTMNDLKIKIQLYVEGKLNEKTALQDQELKLLKEELESEKKDYNTEISRLQELLLGVKCGSNEWIELRQELESKHAKEMEELRTYFEQKCIDMEKHYSEEVFSQQSRKMSGSSSISDAELTSDIFLITNPQPGGPGGDNLKNVNVETSPIKSNAGSGEKNVVELRKSDIIDMKNELKELSNYLHNYDENKLNNEDLNVIKENLAKYNLRSLTKVHLHAFKTELQNKYHAELEILREDYENKIDALNVEHEKKHQNVDRTYEEKIENLQYELDEALKNAHISVSNAVQEVASSGEYELADVVQSYERRLQQQVTMAKFDIIAALEHQIQMLASSPIDDVEWPTELMTLRNKFVEKYEKEIFEMKETHAKELTELKEDYLRKLERSRRRSLKDEEKNIGDDSESQRERECLRKTTAALRNLLRELLKYFTECEDELNNTLIDEILKKGTDKNLNQTESHLNDFNESLKLTKRVHFTPNFNDFLNIVDNTSFASLDSNDLSIEFKNELGSCLERLKSDANAVLALTTNMHSNEQQDDALKKIADNSFGNCDDQSVNVEKTIASLTRQLRVETNTKNNANLELINIKDHVKGLEDERASLENEIEQLIQKQRVLENDLSKAKEKISELVECQRKEIVSEGFGESISAKNRNLDKKRLTLMELQEKARNLVSDNATDNVLFQLIDDLCREADYIVEESKREKEDLMLQIDAADKKLKSTCEFLEIQASEREQERDDAQKEIETLKEQIRDRERDRVSCERINKEDGGLVHINSCCHIFNKSIVSTVELLEQQMNDMTKLMKENDVKQQEIENERKEAIDKIYVLREIIRDLESQIENKTENELQLKNVINELENVINRQTKLNEELTEELTTLKSGPDGKKCEEIIVQLEEELQKFKLNAELTGNETVLQHIKIQLFDIESSIDGRTRDLEALHAAISSTTCSSPTEDMSIKDQVRPYTPNSTLDECDLPLQQLARLKEKLIKHTRAEDAAVKRIRDLEMQLAAFKRDYEEVQADKDVLQEKISDQLVLIASLQMRLDEQRLRADNVSKQTNTSLEIRIYDLENEVQNLTEKICNRDKTIKQLNNAIDETKKRLKEREQELLQMADDKNYIDLENENDKLRKENQLLKDKISVDVQNVQILPNLVDNIIADKNADLEKLREEINSTRKQLEFYTSLNFDKEQLKTLSQLRSSGRAFTEMLTLLEDSERPRAEAMSELVASPIYLKNTPNTTQLNLRSAKLPTETFSIELENTPRLSKPQSNSTEIMKSSEKKVHFEDIATLKEELHSKEEIITEYNKRLNVLEEKYEMLQKNLEITESALKEATETFEKEQNDLKEIEQDLRVELAEKKIYLSESEKKLELEQQDSARKDQMYIDLVKEKKNLEKQNKDLLEGNKHAEDIEKQIDDLRHSAGRVDKLEAEIKEKTDEVDLLKVKLQQIQDELTEKSRILQQFSDEMNEKSDELKVKDEENSKLLKELKNKQSQINLLNDDLKGIKETIKEKDEQIQKLSKEIQEEKQESLKEHNAKMKELQNLLSDKDCEIEILNEDLNRYQNEISKLELRKNTESNFKSNEIQLQLLKNKKELNSKDLEIVKLKSDIDNSTKEILHLREYLVEKDRIIEQIRADSESLRINLETIQSKIQETGNILDLRNRLQEQIEINNNLQSEIINLKHSQNESKHSLDEIEGQVREQLNYSAHLDSSILSAIHSGSEQEDSEHLRKLLNKQKRINNQLKDVKINLEVQLQEFEKRLQAENVKVLQLEVLLENERHNSETIQLEDANLIEQMRLRLDAALENEKEFEKMIVNEKEKFQKLLESEKKIREGLEIKLNALKSGTSSNTNSKSETEYKSLPNLIQMELEHVKKELQVNKEENAKFKREIKTLKQSKFDAETNCKYMNDMLKLKSDEITTLENRSINNKQVEQELRERMIAISSELDQRNREVENSRTHLEEMEEERNQMKNDIAQLNNKIKDLIEEKQMNEILLQEHNANINSAIPDKFMKKMKELSQIVKDHVRNNQVMTDMLSKLNEERRTLQEKITTLEAQNNLNMPFDDPVARANHLFGKYLRSESYRKALIYQKNYLVRLLATYQYFRPVSTNPTLQNLRTTNTRNARSKGISRFKSVVYVLISISRMRFMVQRWHTGKRIGASSAPIITHNRRQLKTNVSQQTAFQLGQPVSSQNFSNPHYSNRSSVVLNLPLDTDDPVYNNNINRNNNLFNNDVPSTSSRSAFNDDRPQGTHATQVPNQQLPPWSGVTPPSKDRSLRGSSRDLPITSTRSDGSAVRDTLPTLSSPELLSRYVERFNQIQNRLGLALENTNSS